MKRRGRSSRPLEIDICAVVGLSAARRRRLLGARKGRSRGRRSASPTWSEIQTILSPGERARARARLLSVHTSAYWVAGYPELVAEWHPDRNVDLFPFEVSYGSRRAIWWKCPRGPDHEWRATPQNRIRGQTGCPFCAGQKASVTNSLATLAPALAREWGRNGALRPHDVTLASDRMVAWVCDEGHRWRARIANRSRGAGCPTCALARADGIGPPRTGQTLASCDVAREWHPTRNAPRTPADVGRGSTMEVWWQCALGHEWRARVGNRTKPTRPSGCPACGRARTNASRRVRAGGSRLPVGLSTVEG